MTARTVAAVLSVLAVVPLAAAQPPVVPDAPDRPPADAGPFPAVPPPDLPPALPPPPDRPPAAPPAEYYLVLFGSDAGPLRPARTHTFGTYVKVRRGPDGRADVAPVTLSWLPADGKVDWWRPFHREPGVNATLDQSLAYAARTGRRLDAFGPFRIDAGWYDAAAAQAARLATGGVKYRAVDSVGRRRGDASHCVHAVTDPVLGDKQPPLRLGTRGTRQVAEAFVAAGAVPDPAAKAWLFPALGLRP